MSRGKNTDDTNNTVHRIEDYLITNSSLSKKNIELIEILNKQYVSHMRFLKGIILIVLGFLALFAGKDLGAFSAFCKLLGL